MGCIWVPSSNLLYGLADPHQVSTDVCVCLVYAQEPTYIHAPPLRFGPSNLVLCSTPSDAHHVTLPRLQPDDDQIRRENPSLFKGKPTTPPFPDLVIIYKENFIPFKLNPILLYAADVPQ